MSSSIRCVGRTRVEQRLRDASSTEVESRAAAARAPEARAVSRVGRIAEAARAAAEAVQAPAARDAHTAVRAARSKSQFWIISAVAGLFCAVVAWMLGATWPIASGLGSRAPRASALGARLSQERARSASSGIPQRHRRYRARRQVRTAVGDCIRIVASESPRPVSRSFARSPSRSRVGIPLSDAVTKMFDRVPLPEANFFGIVITIQQKSGGSLSEALGNLSRVLRERRKMQAKIQAMSMEAKASAAIIAALPIAVMLLVYLSSPQYIELLWTTPLGRTLLFCSGVWMSMGVFVMRRMINSISEERHVRNSDRQAARAEFHGDAAHRDRGMATVLRSPCPMPSATISRSA